MWLEGEERRKKGGREKGGEKLRALRASRAVRAGKEREKSFSS